MADEPQRIVDLFELADRIEGTPSLVISEDERVITACALRWFGSTKTATGKAIGILPGEMDNPAVAVVPVPR